MSESESYPPISNDSVFGDQFGANEWLVNEMYENYLEDPSLVDPAWQTFFAEFKAGLPTPEIPAISVLGSPSVKVPTPVAPQILVPAPPAAAPAPSAGADPTTIPHQQEVVRQSVLTTPTPADPIIKPVPVLITPTAAAVEPLRGVAGRVVQSMEASLTVPTATSVRAIPAKLLIDNRIVINNHLKRGRGGKVSFTHLIAYAMIKALRDMPEMNSFFTQLNDKPAIGHPEHINLGIAIDMAKADGSRQLLVPSIKGCENLDFTQFWVAYEDTVRKARSGTLTVEDFAGTTVSLTNPGTLGTVHSVPRLVVG
ncbi:MAG TPA: 2-oxo acid dehydrogenase subunit E2, partial [Candidatus Nanopelagicaceae bacterium]|nr:2-oxo acid dehydrogenase subunit E2 [Candidatus Nanopelagicaceae bacterium]